MNKLEDAIHSAMLAAHDEYLNMTNYWLSHAPESYITVMIARAIAQLDYSIYIDTSLKRVLADYAKIKGHLPASLSKRSDISVWFKGGLAVRAAVEVKKAYHVAPILKDTEKLGAIIGLVHGPKTGYVVAYSEAKYHESKDTLAKRFKGWADTTNWRLVTSYTDTIKDDNNWVWGFCILRGDHGP